MSRRRKQTYYDRMASAGAKDHFGTLYDGMCKNRQFQALSVGARLFYVLCRVQSKSTQGTSCLYKHGKEENITFSEYDFVFPSSHLQQYGIDRSNANRYFKQLEETGFIEVKENNQHRRKINVYSFSDKWRDNTGE